MSNSRLAGHTLIELSFLLGMTALADCQCDGSLSQQVAQSSPGACAVPVTVHLVIQLHLCYSLEQWSGGGSPSLVLCGENTSATFSLQGALTPAPPGTWLVPVSWEPGEPTQVPEPTHLSPPLLRSQRRCAFRSCSGLQRWAPVCELNYAFLHLGFLKVLFINAMCWQQKVCHTQLVTPMQSWPEVRSIFFSSIMYNCYCSKYRGKGATSSGFRKMSIICDLGQHCFLILVEADVRMLWVEQR